jgi:hypothetical protein
MNLVSKQVKEEIQCDLDIPYGEREGEKFDIFGAQLLPNGNSVDLLNLLKKTFFK